MVAASDYEELGIAMAASVEEVMEEAQEEARAKAYAKAAFDDLVIAILRQKRIYRCGWGAFCLLDTSPSPRDRTRSRMPSSA